MPEFHIKGTLGISGINSERTIFAKDETQARQIAEHLGYIHADIENVQPGMLE